MTGNVVHGAMADPVTERYWSKTMRRARWALISWIASLLASPFLAMALWEAWTDSSSAFLVFVITPVNLAGITVSQLRWQQLKSMRGILEAYPWHEHGPPGDPTHQRGFAVLRLPNPDEPSKTVQVSIRRYGLGRRWRRTVSDVRANGFQFAGDPRFGGVIARPGPQALMETTPRDRYRPNKGERPKDVSEASWATAQAAGVSGESPFTTADVEEFQDDR